MDHVLTASVVECQLMPLIDISINTLSTPQLTPNRCSIDISVDSQLIFDVSQHLADCQPTLDQVLIKHRPRIDRDVNQDVDQGYQSRVSIDTRPRVPLVHMIQHFL